MVKWAGKFGSFMVPAMLVGLFAPVVGADEPSNTAIIDYSTFQQIVDRYLGVRKGESEQRVATEHARLQEISRLDPTSIGSAFVVFARPVQGTEIQNLINTYNLTVLSIETNGTASRVGDNLAGRIDDAQLASIGGSVGLQVNTAVRELRERYIAEGLALKERDPLSSSRLLMLASSADFGIYRATFKGRTIDFVAATADPAVYAVILTPLAGNGWKRVFP